MTKHAAAKAWELEVFGGRRYSTNVDPGGGEHANEPEGASLVVNRAFVALDEDGWQDSDGENTFAATLSMSGGILRSTFPAGHPGTGSSSRCTQSNYQGWGATTHVYLDARVRYSANWYGQDGSSVNKILYIGDMGSNPVVLDAHGGGSAAMRLRVALQGGETTNLDWDDAANGVSPSAAEAEIVRDEWTTIELVIVANTPGSPDGEIHAWINGVKTHEFTGLNIYPGGANLAAQWIHVHPIYGGGGGSAIPADQYIEYDRLYVSAI